MPSSRGRTRNGREVDARSKETCSREWKSSRLGQNSVQAKIAFAKHSHGVPVCIDFADKESPKCPLSYSFSVIRNDSRLLGGERLDWQTRKSSCGVLNGGREFHRWNVGDNILTGMKE